MRNSWFSRVLDTADRFAGDVLKSGFSIWWMVVRPYLVVILGIIVVGGLAWFGRKIIEAPAVDRFYSALFDLLARLGLIP